jgi:hypothetical protein
MDNPEKHATKGTQGEEKQKSKHDTNISVDILRKSVLLEI